MEEKVSAFLFSCPFPFPFPCPKHYCSHTSPSPPPCIVALLACPLPKTCSTGRLAALAILRKLAAGARPNVGAIVTINELEMLEKTVRAAAQLDKVTEAHGHSLESAKHGEHG